MKSAPRILLCSVAVLLLHVSQAYAATPLAGTWVNVDENSGSLTRLEVTEEADGWVIHAWGSCSPNDCDWGKVPLYMAVSDAAHTLGHGFAYWDHKEKNPKVDIRTFTMLHVDDDTLVVESFDVYGKAAGRPKEEHHVRVKDSFKRVK
jgi:hypothetical protein